VEVHPLEWFIVGELQPLGEDYHPVKEQSSQIDILKDSTSAVPLYRIARKTVINETKIDSITTKIEVSLVFESKPWQYTYNRDKYTKGVPHCFVISVFFPVLSQSSDSKSIDIELISRYLSPSFTLPLTTKNLIQQSINPSASMPPNENEDTIPLSLPFFNQFHLVPGSPIASTVPFNAQPEMFRMRRDMPLFLPARIKRDFNDFSYYPPLDDRCLPLNSISLQYHNQNISRRDFCLGNNNRNDSAPGLTEQRRGCRCSCNCGDNINNNTSDSPTLKRPRLSDDSQTTECNVPWDIQRDCSSPFPAADMEQYGALPKFLSSTPLTNGMDAQKEITLSLTPTQRKQFREKSINELYDPARLFFE
jgi:hypothetical protein